MPGANNFVYTVDLAAVEARYEAWLRSRTQGVMPMSYKSAYMVVEPSPLTPHMPRQQLIDFQPRDDDGQDSRGVTPTGR